MRNRDTFQFSLVLIVLLLSISTLLFGWVYLASLDNKFQAVIGSPLVNDEDRFAELEEYNEVLQDEIDKLYIELANLKSDVSNPTRQPIEFEKLPLPDNSDSVELPTEETVDISVDQKCLQDPDDLDQCAVLGSIPLGDNYYMLIRPLASINTEINEIAFQVFKGSKKITELKVSSAALFDEGSLATIAFISENDITLTTKVGISKQELVYTYDGVGWIDYSQFSSN